MALLRVYQRKLLDWSIWVVTVQTLGASISESVQRAIARKAGGVFVIEAEKEAEFPTSHQVDYASYGR
jgi:hypothetical protein